MECAKYKTAKPLQDHEPRYSWLISTIWLSLAWAVSIQPDVFSRGQTLSLRESRVWPRETTSGCMLTALCSRLPAYLDKTRSVFITVADLRFQIGGFRGSPSARRKVFDPARFCRPRLLAQYWRKKSELLRSSRLWNRRSFWDQETIFCCCCCCCCCCFIR